MVDVWCDRFIGLKPKKDAPAAEAATAAPGTSKRKAAAKKEAAKVAAAAAAGGTGQESPEVLALERRVADLSSMVRELKGSPKSEEGDTAIAAAVEEKKRLKAEFTETIKAQQV